MVSLRELARTAFRTVWRHKILWLFGIFLSFFNSGYIFNYAADEARLREFLTNAGLTLSGLGQLWLLALAMLVLLAMLLIIFLSFAFRGAVIDLVRDAQAGRQIRGRHGLSTGIHKAAPMLLKSTLLWLPFYVVSLIVLYLNARFAIQVLTVGPRSETTELVLLVIATLLLIFLLMVVGLIVAIINRFADRLIVLEGERVVAALTTARAMFRRYPGDSLLAWLLMAGITIAVLIVFSAVTFFVIFGTASVARRDLFLALVIAITGAVFILIPLGLFEAFGSAFWTHFFLAERDRDAHRERGAGTRQAAPAEVGSFAGEASITEGSAAEEPQRT